MNILGVAGVVLLACVLAFSVGGLCEAFDRPRRFKILCCVTICMVILSGCTSVYVGTEKERLYVVEYCAQKEVIEASLENENLTGIERIQLVQQAAELNGEFARKKETYSKWYFIVWGHKDLYDGIEPINLGG